MKITIEAGKAKIFTQYNAEFIEKIKNIGGRRWNGADRCWEVPESEIETVRQYMTEVFGETDQDEGERVTIKLTFNEDADAERNAVVIYGKTIARATGRDSGARVGDEATLISGSISSGGSMRNWRTTIKAGSVFKVRNIPKKALEMDTEYDITTEILQETGIDIESLLEERDRLIARLDEIGELLAGENDEK